MNKTEALVNLSAEQANMTAGAKKELMQLAIDVLSGDSTEKTEEEALEDLNDLYFDYASFSNRQLVGESIFVISYTVDPSKPSPHTRDN